MKQDGGWRRSLVDEDAACQKGFGREVPLPLDLVKIYFDQKGYGFMAETFYDERKMESWENKRGNSIRNWKEAASEYIFNHAFIFRRSRR